MPRLIDFIKPYELAEALRRMMKEPRGSFHTIQRATAEIDDLAGFRDALTPLIIEYASSQGFTPDGVNVCLMASMTTLHVFDRALQAREEEKPKPATERLQ